MTGLPKRCTSCSLRVESKPVFTGFESQTLAMLARLTARLEQRFENREVARALIRLYEAREILLGAIDAKLSGPPA